MGMNMLLMNSAKRGVHIQLAISICGVWLVCPNSNQAADQPDLAPLIGLLGEIDAPDVQLDLLRGIRDGIRGRRDLEMPKGWKPIYAKLSKSKDPAVRKQARFLALTFGDQDAIANLRRTMVNKKADADLRTSALDALVQHQVKGLDSDLHRLIDDDALRGPAIRGLAAYSNANTPKILIERFKIWTAAERQDVVHTLASRADYAEHLLEAIAGGTIPRTEISAFTARQIENLGDQTLRDQLLSVWGSIRKTTEAKKKLITKYKKLITTDFLKNADLSSGRLVFSKTCQKCHRLYGEGGKIGPDLTGSNRKNLDYVLENVIDPSAVIPRDYRLTVIATVKGRVINGIIAERTDNSLTVLTENEKIIVSKEDIDEMSVSDVSMMPDGQFEKLKEHEIRNLIAYLRTNSQVRLPATVGGGGDSNSRSD